MNRSHWIKCEVCDHGGWMMWCVYSIQFFFLFTFPRYGIWDVTYIFHSSYDTFEASCIFFTHLFLNSPIYTWNWNEFTSFFPYIFCPVDGFNSNIHLFVFNLAKKKKEIELHMKKQKGKIPAISSCHSILVDTVFVLRLLP